MRRCYWLIALCMAFRAATAYPDDHQRPAATVEISSPDERLRVEVVVEPAGNASVPRYRVLYRDRPVVLASRLGAELDDGTTLGNNSVVEKVAHRSFEEVYDQNKNEDIHPFFVQEPLSTGGTGGQGHR